MLKKIVVACVALIVSAPAFGQVTPDEARQRLEQRQRERAAAAATRPAADRVAELEAEVAKLKAENARLRGALATAVAEMKKIGGKVKEWQQAQAEADEAKAAADEAAAPAKAKCDLPDKGSTPKEVAALMTRQGFRRTASANSGGFTTETYTVRKGFEALAITFSYREGKLVEWDHVTIGY